VSWLDKEKIADAWERFWHEPVAAERLALLRICSGIALLTDLLLQYLPYFGYLFGPHGMGAEGLNDRWMSNNWRWPVMFFTTDDMFVLGSLFGLWALSAVALIVGFKTRFAAFVAWFLTMCFFARNSNVKNGGDDIIQIVLFWLMFMPSNRALAWDARKLEGPQQTAPWGVRVMQMQMCAMYTSTGVAKLRGGINGTWLNGTSLHYVYNDIGLVRWSYAQFPMPIWVTAPIGYLSLIWEVFFIALVLYPKSRFWALLFGIGFHMVVYLSLEVGWFSFYSIALYPVWINSKWFTDVWHPWVRRLRGAAASVWRKVAAVAPT
jgi:hypothetical protein